MAAAGRPQLIGLDIGTSACKAGLVDTAGEILALATIACEVTRPHAGWAEQDTRGYWDAAVRCIRELLASPRAEPRRIAGLASCGHAPTMVLLDDRQEPLRPAILWQDTRAVAEAEELATNPGTDVLAGWLGVRWPVDASMPAARFRWLGKHEPASLAHTRLVLLPKDYVHLRLTGAAATDVWSAKGLVHQQTREPIGPLLEMAGVGTQIVPPALVPSEIMGHVSAAASEETGLPVGTPVIAGWTDAMAAMLGSGALGSSGLGCDVSGTSEVIGLTHGSRPLDTGPLMAAAILDSGRWMVYGPTQASGGSLSWALRALGELNPEQALAEAAHAEPGADGLLFLPYLQGERAPLWDPRARGAFIGLTMAHERRHLLRAVLEGVACSVRHVLSAAEAFTGATAEEVRVAGGGARVGLWNQIKADVTGRTFRPCTTTENGVLGAAMLAAIGAGLFDGAAAAGKSMVSLEAPVEPDPHRHALYETTFERYIGAYPRLRDLFI